MKRIAVLVVMVLVSLSATANSVRYFTSAQANRAVAYLNAQDEMMIYCGYDYEIETYVLISEVWRERVNSSFYEIWVFGYDAYTGDEIYMPLDLQCVWLFSPTGQHVYNAAQYLRFRTSARTPSFAWYIPPYNRFTRVAHRHGYTRTYHYDVHLYGWMPPAHPTGSAHHHGGKPGPHPLPDYYMRTPQSPAPASTAAWTPGTDKPAIVTKVSSRSSGSGRGTATTQTDNKTTTTSSSSTATSRRGTTTQTDNKTTTTSSSSTATSRRGTTTQTDSKTSTSSSSSSTATSRRSSSTSSSTTPSSTTTGRKKATSEQSVKSSSTTAEPKKTTATSRKVEKTTPKVEKTVSPKVEKTTATSRRK